MNLYAHQQALLDRDPDRELLCWDTGTGKTRASIEWANQKDKDLLVICPKALKENWYRELQAYTTDTFYWQVMSKEEFRKNFEFIQDFPTIIIDEAHYFSGPKSQMTKNLRKYLKSHSVPYVLELTATPYMSTPWNIFTLAGHLGHNWNWKQFEKDYFEDRWIGKKKEEGKEEWRGGRLIKVVKEDIEEDMAKLVGEIGNVIRLDECADVPDQVFENEYFKPTASQKKGIEETVETNPIVRYTRHHQIENGVLKSDGYDPDKFFKCDKNERILELCQANKKVAIVCRYNLQIDYLNEYLRSNTEERDIFIIRGDTKDKDKEVRAAEDATNCIVLINAQASEGYELPSIGLIIFASLSFSYKDYKQIVGRFLRINALKKNVYIHLITTDGVDQGVYNSMLKKQDFDINIYDR